MNFPVQLQQNPELRFILLRGRTKIPLEKEWQKTANYSLEELKTKLQPNQNFGVLCGKSGLAVVDLDKKANPPEFERVLEKWSALSPKT
ncbi:MAG: bifunctional DNA primase/polymerase, partial [Patescibacteria group bacterium]